MSATLAIVHYIARNGQPAQSAKMPLAIATNYAKTVKSGKVVPCDGSATVNVVKVAAATEQDIKASTRAFYAQRTNTTWQTPAQRAEQIKIDRANASEHQAEIEAEAFGAAIAAGCDPWA